MNPRHVRSHVLLLQALGLLVLLGCNGGEESSSVRTGEEVSQPEKEGGTPSSSRRDLYRKLFRYIPNKEPARGWTHFSDYLALAKASGIPKPKPTDSPETVFAYVTKVTGLCCPYAGPFGSGYGPYARKSAEGMKRDAGFDARNIEAAVATGMPPIAVLKTDANFDLVKQRLRESKRWKTPQSTEYRGVEILYWGRDNYHHIKELKERPPLIPVYDEAGYGARWGFADGVLLFSTDLTIAKAMIDAKKGDGESLMDVVEYGLLVKGLADLGIYSAILSNMERWPGDDDEEAVPYKIRREYLLKPVQVLATSVGKDEKGFFMGLVLVHDTRESALANKTLLRERLMNTGSYLRKKPWKELYDLKGLEIVAEDRILKAKLRFPGDTAKGWWQEWIVARDPLVLWK